MTAIKDSLERIRTRLPRSFTHVFPFLRLLVSRFLANNSLQYAAAMTYTTLLSLVPLIAVSIAVFSVFPVADKVSMAIQDFVFENFVPASGDVLQSYLDEFSSKAAGMTGTSFVFLIIVAVMLMGSIDQAFNRIWRVRRKRGLLKKFMVYWAALSLGPILMALSIAVTSYIISLPLLSDSGVFEPASKLLVFAPVAVSSFAFMLLYLLIPNRAVPFRHALAGGVVAGVLFELAKRGFGLYVTHFPTYEAIYGALATVPIFLVWLYLSWLVTLLGAEFTYCLSVYRYQKSRDEIYRGDRLLQVLQLIGRLWLAQQRGESLSLASLARDLNVHSEESIEQLLIRMQKSRLVITTYRYEWALARDLSNLSLAGLYQALPMLMPQTDEIDLYNGPGEQAVKQLMHELLEQNQQMMDRSLEELFHGKP